jgi:hypothetical protein
VALTEVIRHRRLGRRDEVAHVAAERLLSLRLLDAVGLVAAKLLHRRVDRLDAAGRVDVELDAVCNE